MLYLAIASGMLIISLAILSVSSFQILHIRRAIQILQLHQVAANSACQKARMDLQEVGDRAKLIEYTISGGATAMEKFHNAITSTTFGLIDRFVSDAEVRQNVRVIRKTHDQTSQQIYHSVRTTNKALRILADTVIIRRSKHSSESERTAKGRYPAPTSEPK